MTDNERDVVADALAITDEELMRQGEEEQALAEKEGFYLIPDGDIYPGVNDIGKMKLVYRDFMKGGDLVEIAGIHGVNTRTAMKWAENGQWVRRRKGVENAALEEEQQQIEALRLRHRKKSIEQQIESSRKLRGRIDSAVEDEELTPGQLKQLAEAHKATADVESRALGMNESGLSASQQEGRAKADAENRRPLVLVVPGGGLPQAVRREKKIDDADVVSIGE